MYTNTQIIAYIEDALDPIEHRDFAAIIEANDPAFQKALNTFFESDEGKPWKAKYEQKRKQVIERRLQWQSELADQRIKKEMPQVDDLLILDYLSGYLVEQDNTIIQQMIDRSPVLASYVEEQKLLLNEINNDTDDSLESLVKKVDINLAQEDFFTSIDTDAPAKPKDAKVRSLWSRNQILSIAAAIALLMLAGYFILRDTSPNYEELYAQYHQKEIQAINQLLDDVGTSGIANPNPTKQALVAPLQSFRNNDFVQAQSLLIEYLNNTPNDNDAQFLLGLTLMELGQFNPAAATLEPISQQENEWQPAAQFHLAMAYLNIPQRADQANDLLQIVAQKEGPYQEQAQAVLDAY